MERNQAGRCYIFFLNKIGCELAFVIYIYIDVINGRYVSKTCCSVVSLTYPTVVLQVNYCCKIAFNMLGRPTNWG